MILRAGGELDASDELKWQRLLHKTAAATRAPGLLVVDAEDLEFMACCAFTALADEAVRCRHHGIGVCLVSRKPITARIIAAGGLSLRLNLYPDIETALSAINDYPRE